MRRTSSDGGRGASEPAETGWEGVKMVAVWILLVMVLVGLTRRGQKRRR